MGEITGKVKEKATDVKDKGVDNTKDIIDAAKDSVSTTSSLSPSSPLSSKSISYSNGPENKHEKSSLGPDYGKIDSPLTEYRIKEPEITPAPTMGVPEPIVSVSDTSVDVLDKTQANQQESYRESSSDFFNPFVMGIKMWQNYSTMWMNFYSKFLNSTTKKAKDYGNKY
jgi:hypothetical protein